MCVNIVLYGSMNETEWSAYEFYMTTFILSFSKLKRGNEPVKVIRKPEKYLLPFFFRAGEEVLGVSRIASGILCGFP